MWLFLNGHSASSLTQKELGLCPVSGEEPVVVNLNTALFQVQFVGVFPPFDPRNETNLTSETLRSFSNMSDSKGLET
jgi:hypothetical protein